MPLTASSPLIVLLDHDRWATAVLLDRCRELPPEDFARRFDIGPGSLHDTLTHIVGAARRWIDRIAESPLRASIEGTTRTAEQLRALHEEAASQFRKLALRLQHENRWDETFHAEFPGDDGRPRRYTYTRAAAVAHVFVHGAHHRAQCLRMLRQLRPDQPPPHVDVLAWQQAHWS